MGAGRDGGTDGEDEAIARAWRDYRGDPEKGGNDLLRALDPMVVRAVKRWGEKTLAKCHWAEAAQEVRLRLVPRRFLLQSPALQALAVPVGEETEQRKATIVQTIKNIIYMVAYWTTMDAAGKLRRHGNQLADIELDEIVQEEAADNYDVEARMAQVRAALREQGYRAGEVALFVSYVEGLINQDELGQGLGIKQSAASKRLQKLRRKLALRAPPDHD